MSYTKTLLGSLGLLAAGSGCVHGPQLTTYGPARRLEGEEVYLPARGFSGRDEVRGELLWATPDTAFLLVRQRVVAVPRAQGGSVRRGGAGQVGLDVPWRDLPRRARYRLYVGDALRRTVLAAHGQTAPDPLPPR